MCFLGFCKPLDCVLCTFYTATTFFETGVVEVFCYPRPYRCMFIILQISSKASACTSPPLQLGRLVLSRCSLPKAAKQNKEAIKFTSRLRLSGSWVSQPVFLCLTPCVLSPAFGSSPAYTQPLPDKDVRIRVCLQKETHWRGI